MRLANVMQHEFAVLHRDSIEDYLATRNVVCCTGWIGWDAKNEVGFLCHFDSPLSARSTLSIMDTIRSYVSDSHHFESSLFGGTAWLLGYSQKTRKMIRQTAEDNQHILNIKVNELPLGRNPFTGIDVSIDKTGRMSYQPVSGDSHLPGGAWFFKPMMNAEKR